MLYRKTCSLKSLSLNAISSLTVCVFSYTGCGYLGVESTFVGGTDTEIADTEIAQTDIETDTKIEFNTDTFSRSDTTSDTYSDVDSEPETDTGPIPTCDDIILNQDEIRTDCGGTICSPCPACRSAFGPPEELSGLRVSGEVYSPTVSLNGLTLYFALLDGDKRNIYTATRVDRGTVFSEATFVTEVNTADSEGGVYLSADGFTLYFYSTRPGGIGERDIWTATRPAPVSPFNPPILLPSINSSANDHLPALTADELTIIFTSERNEGMGDSDLWIAERSTKQDDFRSPSNLATLNSSHRETGAALSADGLVIFFISDRNGDNDIYSATRLDSGEAFDQVTPVTVLNSDQSEYDAALSPDEQEIFFASRRSGEVTLWRAWRDCP